MIGEMDMFSEKLSIGMTSNKVQGDIEWYRLVTSINWHFKCLYIFPFACAK